MDWLHDAPCKGVNQDFFYPPLEASSPNQYYAIGKLVCHSCPVWKDCLEYAEGNEEVWGMWGGITPQERKRRASLRHGTLESKRLGCTCNHCLAVRSVENSGVDLSTLPRSGEDYDLQSLVFNTTKR